MIKPNKKILIIGAVVVAAILFFLLPGKAIVTVSQEGGFVLIEDKKQSSPVTLTNRFGKREYQIGAEGYLTEFVPIQFYPLTNRRVTVVLTTTVEDVTEVDESKDEPAWAYLLPKTTDHYQIEHSEATKSLTVTLFAIFNSEEQRESYQQDLATYAREAIAWMESSQINYTDFPVEWLPENPL